MNLLRSWILGLTSASLVAAAARVLTPEGNVRRVTEFMCGAMLACMLLSPALKMDRDAFSRALAEQRALTAELTEDLEGREKQLLRPYIQEQCAAYILDEAQRLGITDLRCSVRVKWRDESWVPFEVTLHTAAPREARQRLGDYLDGELGIPPERQRWNEDG